MSKKSKYDRSLTENMLVMQKRLFDILQQQQNQQLEIGRRRIVVINLPFTILSQRGQS